eukprot:tig00000396_g24899.t1
MPQKLQYDVSASSEDPEECGGLQQLPLPLAVGQRRDLGRPTGWTSERLCGYPQELLFSFEELSRVTAMRLLLHETRIPERCEIFAGRWTYLPDGNRRMNWSRVGFFPCASNEDTLHVSRELKTVYFETVCDALRLSLHRCFLNRFNLHQQVSVVRATLFGEPIRDEYGLGAPPEIAVPPGGPALVSEERRLAGPHALEPENPPLRAPRDDPIGLDTYVVPLLHEVRAAKERAAGGENFEEAQRLKKAEDRLLAAGVRRGAALARLRTFLRAGDLAGAKATQADVDNLQRFVDGIVAAARAGRGPIPDVPGAPPTPPLPPAPEPGAAVGPEGGPKGGARGRIPFWPRPKAGDDPFEVLDACRAAIAGLLREDPEDEPLAAADPDGPPAWWEKPSKPQAKKKPARRGEEPSSPPPAAQRQAVPPQKLSESVPGFRPPRGRPRGPPASRAPLSDRGPPRLRPPPAPVPLRKVFPSELSDGDLSEDDAGGTGTAAASPPRLRPPPGLGPPVRDAPRPDRAAAFPPAASADPFAPFISSTRAPNGRAPVPPPRGRPRWGAANAAAGRGRRVPPALRIPSVSSLAASSSQYSSSPRRRASSLGGLGGDWPSPLWAPQIPEDSREALESGAAFEPALHSSSRPVDDATLSQAHYQPTPRENRRPPRALRPRGGRGSGDEVRATWRGGPLPRPQGEEEVGEEQGQPVRAASRGAGSASSRGGSGPGSRPGRRPGAPQAAAAAAAGARTRQRRAASKTGAAAAAAEASRAAGPSAAADPSSGSEVGSAAARRRAEARAHHTSRRTAGSGPAGAGAGIERSERSRPAVPRSEGAAAPLRFPRTPPAASGPSTARAAAAAAAVKGGVPGRQARRGRGGGGGGAGAEAPPSRAGGAAGAAARRAGRPRLPRPSPPEEARGAEPARRSGARARARRRRRHQRLQRQRSGGDGSGGASSPGAPRRRRRAGRLRHPPILASPSLPALLATGWVQARVPRRWTRLAGRALSASAAAERQHQRSGRLWYSPAGARTPRLAPFGSIPPPPRGFPPGLATPDRLASPRPPPPSVPPPPRLPAAAAPRAALAPRQPPPERRSEAGRSSSPEPPCLA